jgi:ATP-dependent Clp protease ATP-binding subunit ClpA
MDMQEMMIMYGKMHYHQNILNPFAVLCKMYLEDRQLKYKAIELL